MLVGMYVAATKQNFAQREGKVQASPFNFPMCHTTSCFLLQHVQLSSF